MPGLFNTPKTPAPPPIPAPVPMPVPVSANQAQQQAVEAQTIARTQATSGRESTNLTGQGQTLGGN